MMFFARSKTLARTFSNVVFFFVDRRYESIEHEAVETKTALDVVPSEFLICIPIQDVCV